MNTEQRQAAADPHKPSQSTLAMGCYCLHPPSPFIIITQIKSW